MDLAATLRDRLDRGGDAEQLAFDGRWRSWGWMAQVDAAVAEATGSARRIGLIARTRPQHVAAFAGALSRRVTTAMIYSAQSAAAIAADIRALQLEAVLADAEDWSPEALQAALETGSAAIALADEPDGQRTATMLLARGKGPFHEPSPDIAVELLSSGTTGAPKRVPLAWATLESATDDARVVYGGGAAAPQVMTQPLGNVTGIAYVVPPLAFGQQIAMLEKFEPRAWARTIRTYRPIRVSLPPVGIRMVLDAGIAREDLASLTVVGIGGGKVEQDVIDRFERDYGIPVLQAFGATEFGGVVANWTLDLYREWGAAKRGSAGRASRNVALRVVDADRFEPVAPDTVGLLEAQVKRLGPDWIRTNDLASIDTDGFLFLHGRADGAINRGGFKIVPETVVSVLRAHPAVSDAAVVGRTDARLGEVPVAAVELTPGADADEASLTRWARERLLAYQVPAAIRILPSLPRNASLKVAIPEIKALFA